MCTIMTFSNEFYQDNRADLRDRIKTDARFNGDGWNLLGIDPENGDNDIQLSAMQCGAILKQIDQFFDSASNLARIFLHARSATTSDIGIAFCHGFTDFNGRVIMHNGIIDNKEKYAIDSYRLIDLPEDDLGIEEFLDARADQYVNAFIIDTVGGSYTVIRRTVGSLYMDDEGNYSTFAVGDICLPVPFNSIEKFDLISEYSRYSDILGTADDSYLSWFIKGHK